MVCSYIGNAGWGSGATQKQLGIDRGVVEYDCPVQVWAGDTAGSADRADAFPFFDRLPGLYVGAREMHVSRDQPLPVVDEDCVAVEELIASISDDTGGRRLDRGAGADGDIEPGMRVAWLAVEDTAQAEA